MNKKEIQPFFIMIGLLILTSFALAYTVDVTISDESGVRTEFPREVGSWKGEEIRFCQNPDCRGNFIMSELTDPEVCPECGDELHTMTIAEKALLPPDTILVKNLYLDPEGRRLISSIVLSGRERSSIHRPQLCLTGQGSEIVSSHVIQVPLPGRKPLDVMVLDLIRRRAVGKDVFEQYSYYAYWFSGKDRETASHVKRMLWMGTDRIFRNVAHRWAYISVSGDREASGEAHVQEIEDFVGILYPQITLN